MPKQNIVPVLLSGGSGTRLWPASRKMYPKQFIDFTGGGSLLQNTVTRLPREYLANTLTVCNEEHRFIAAEQLAAVGVENPIILEPAGRNTAPAVAIAALSAIEQFGKDTILAVFPADHVLTEQTEFLTALEKAVALAEEGFLATFGVVPERAHTGYGYIRAGRPANVGGFEVSEFVEKPSLELASQYLESGDFYWNSGMFVFGAESYLRELQEHADDIATTCKRAFEGCKAESDFIRLDAEVFSGCRSESIDYAVMEKTERAVMVPLRAGWSDIGEWDALYQQSEKDKNSNVIIGDVVTADVGDSYVRAESRLVSMVGVEGLIVVETADSVLVASREKSQEVKRVVEELRSSGRQEATLHRHVHRPWGEYDSIDAGARYQVKRITVKPGAKLSVQMHHHRAEHWVIVSGIAKVTKGGDTFLLSENQSTYIPVGVVHSLENPGKVELELIEVQSGAYLGEDDIVRYEDNYGRA